MSLESEIKEFGKERGLDIVRITSANYLSEAEKHIKESISYGYIPKKTDWKIKDIHSYCDPKSVLPYAKSVIVAAECYLTSEIEDSTEPGNPYGRIARYTWRNYYYDIWTKLKKVIKFIKNKVGAKHKFKCYSCGPLAEKPLAQNAGIGWYGKHGIIITEEYGSWVVLGEIITTLELKPDTPIQKDCGNCDACIKACPTNAIVAPYVLDRSKCIQHLTNWYGMIPLSMREVWSNRLYGCTTCQDICPLNQKVKPKERKPDYGYIGSSIPLIPLLQMSEEEFRLRFRHNQVGARWIRRRCIQRNAIIALGNIGDPVAVPALINALNEPNPIIRGHAAWALGKIGGTDAKVALEKAFKATSDKNSKQEIKNALQLLSKKFEI